MSIFKLNYFENDASYEKILFYVFDLFFHVKSPASQLYRNTLYFCIEKVRVLN